MGGAMQKAVTREKRSKRSADPTLAKESLSMKKMIVGMEKAPIPVTSSVEATTTLSEEEEGDDEATAHPLPSASFGELHRMLGVIHKVRKCFILLNMQYLSSPRGLSCGVEASRVSSAACSNACCIFLCCNSGS
jgi:hypothetical protein